MRTLSSQRRAALLSRLRPHSLRAQFAVALSAMAILIVVGGATAFLALFATGNAARQFSEEQLARAQNTQDLQQRTVQIELLAERMVAAEAGALARQTYARILGELDALDQLTARLAVSEDVSVLDLHQSSQLFRNSAHDLAQLRDAAQRPEPAEVSSAGALRSYRDEMRVHAQALAQSAREQSDRLARAHQAAVLRVVDASQASAYWVVAWLAFSLVTAWLIARVFLGQHVISRLQQISRSLLRVDDHGEFPPHVAVHGDDEIGAMARAVERFLGDRRQLATTRTLLEAEQQRLTAIIDNTADSIVVLQGGRVLQLNRAAERMFGLSNAQAADQPGDALLADFDLTSGAVPGAARDALARSRDGSITPVEVSLNPVTAGTGSLVVLVIRDATLRRQAERHLITARDAAVAAGHALLPVRGHATAPDHRAVVRGSHVLVVEDNAINREHILELLRSAGIVVSVACDGQEALDLLDQQRFDAVLMDCLMPVMDGYAATRALRLRPGLQALPVIALTANAMAGDRDKAFAAGMSDHVAKPVNIEELFATLARWVSPAGGGLAGTADTGAA